MIAVVAYANTIDPNILIGTAAAILTAAGLVVAVLQGNRAARAEKERDEERRLAAQPSIVIETEPDRLAIPGAQMPRLAVLAFKPGPDGLAAGACLDKPSPSAQSGAVWSTEYGGPKRPHVNLHIVNVGQSAAVSLRLPIKFTYIVTTQDPQRATDPSDYGLHGEMKSVTLDLPLIPTLEPRPAEGAHFCIWNETGLAVTIESTGSAFDVDPLRNVSRKVVASTPAKINLPPP
jgi:hypothetical protein